MGKEGTCADQTGLIRVSFQDSVRSGHCQLLRHVDTRFPLDLLVKTVFHTTSLLCTAQQNQLAYFGQLRLLKFLLKLKFVLGFYKDQ